MEQSLIKKLAVTFEMCGGTPSEAATEAIVARLECYDPRMVSKSLDRCQVEVKGRLALADIVSRMDDGRPTADEAWAMIPHNEELSVVWTEEMRSCYGLVAGMSDKVAARRSFIDAYNKACIEARGRRETVSWDLSAGTDFDHKVMTLQTAVDKGLLSPARAVQHEPYLLSLEAKRAARQIGEGKSNRRLPEAYSREKPTMDQIDAMCSSVIEMCSIEEQEQRKKGC